MNSKIINYLSIIIGTEAVLVMAGWIFNIDSLTRIIPNMNNMKFPTALLFLMSAAGLYFICQAVQKNYGMAYIVLPGLVLTISLIASALLFGNIFNVRAGFETVFVREGASLFGAGSGWPSIPTLISFILFAVASATSLFPGEIATLWIGRFGYVLIFLNIIPVFGYLFQIPALYYGFISFSSPISLNSALTFVLLGSGMVIISKMKTTHEV